MRWRATVQVLIVAVVAAVLGYAVVRDADDWADWVVFGVLVLGFFGFAIAVHQRRYPTRKRAYRRDPDSRW